MIPNDLTVETPRLPWLKMGKAPFWGRKSTISWDGAGFLPSTVWPQYVTKLDDDDDDDDDDDNWSLI